MRNRMNLFLISVFALLLSACGQESQTTEKGLQEGEHYFKYENILKGSSSNLAKANVIEFFSYSCGHCQDFAPQLKAWSKKNPDQVIGYVPVVWNQQTGVYARVFYALEEQPNFDANHHALLEFFRTLGGEKTLAEQMDKIYNFLASKGVDIEKLKSTVESQLLEEKLKYSIELSKNYEIRGTPTLVLNGSMVINDKALKKKEDLFLFVDELLNK